MQYSGIRRDSLLTHDGRHEGFKVLQQRKPSFSIMGREEKQWLVYRECQPLTHHTDMFGTPTRLDFIRFGGHCHYADSMVLEPLAQLLILHSWGVAQINNMDNGSECVALLQIRFDHWLPAGLNCPWHFSIAVSRQIDEKKALIDQKKGDRLGFPRCRTDLG
jgi:hypothetical protein